MSEPTEVIKAVKHWNSIDDTMKKISGIHSNMHVTIGYATNGRNPIPQNISGVNEDLEKVSTLLSQALTEIESASKKLNE
jgi:hypothetical protein